MAASFQRARVLRRTPALGDSTMFVVEAMQRRRRTQAVDGETFLHAFATAASGQHPRHWASFLVHLGLPRRPGGLIRPCSRSTTIGSARLPR